MPSAPLSPASPRASASLTLHTGSQPSSARRRPSAPSAASRFLRFATFRLRGPWLLASFVGWVVVLCWLYCCYNYSAGWESVILVHYWIFSSISGRLAGLCRCSNAVGLLRVRILVVVVEFDRLLRNG